jgi:hypothetical protein
MCSPCFLHFSYCFLPPSLWLSQGKSLLIVFTLLNMSFLFSQIDLMLIFSLPRLSFYTMCSLQFLAYKYAFAFSSICLAQYERPALLSLVFLSSRHLFKLFFCVTVINFSKHYPKSTGGKYLMLSNPCMIHCIIIVMIHIICETFKHSGIFETMSCVRNFRQK